MIGYSVNDTIVIFDRVRENLLNVKSEFKETVNTSIIQTLSRTILTVITVLIVLIPLFFFGGPIIRDFSLIMIIGVIIGTYSSIFVASPILKTFKVSYKTLEKKRRKNSSLNFTKEDFVLQPLLEA